MRKSSAAKELWVPPGKAAPNPPPTPAKLPLEKLAKFSLKTPANPPASTPPTKTAPTPPTKVHPSLKPTSASKPHTAPKPDYSLLPKPQPLLSPKPDPQRPPLPKRSPSSSSVRYTPAPTQTHRTPPFPPKEPPPSPPEEPPPSPPNEPPPSPPKEPPPPPPKEPPPPPPKNPPPPLPPREEDWDSTWGHDDDDEGVDEFEQYNPQAQDDAKEDELRNPYWKLNLLQMDPALPQNISRFTQYTEMAGPGGGKRPTSVDSGYTTVTDGSVRSNTTVRSEPMARASYQDPSFYENQPVYENPVEGKYEELNPPPPDRSNKPQLHRTVSESDAMRRKTSFGSNMPIPEYEPFRTHRETKKVDPYPWYFDSAKYEDAERLLKCKDDGVFLIRPSTSGPETPYTLSLQIKGKVHHHHILSRNKCYALASIRGESQLWFKTLQELVSHFQRQRVEHRDGAGSNKTFLTHPPDKEEEEQVYYGMFDSSMPEKL